MGGSEIRSKNLGTRGGSKLEGTGSWCKRNNTRQICIARAYLDRTVSEVHVSPGRGGVPFEKVFRALNAIGYEGPFSVEWEDNNMNRDQGAPEALKLVRSLDLTPSDVLFDDAFQQG